MNNLTLGLKWFESTLKPLLTKDFEIKYVNDKGGDLGDLAGIQFDSLQVGGYIYFWSSNYVSYQLVDYSNGKELVKDTTENILSKSYSELFKLLLEYFSPEV